MKFYALPDNWYDEGTEVIIVAECGTVYSFEDGKKIPSLHLLCRGYKGGYIDEEMCNSEEFALVNDDYFTDNQELRNDR